MEFVNECLQSWDVLGRFLQIEVRELLFLDTAS